MKSLSTFQALICNSTLLVRGYLLQSEYIQSSRLTAVCSAITLDKMFSFGLLYILVVQAWSWLYRKVNATAGAAEQGEK